MLCSFARKKACFYVIVYEPIVMSYSRKQYKVQSSKFYSRLCMVTIDFV